MGSDGADVMDMNARWANRRDRVAVETVSVVGVTDSDPMSTLQVQLSGGEVQREFGSRRITPKRPWTGTNFLLSKLQHVTSGFSGSDREQQAVAGVIYVI